MKPTRIIELQKKLGDIERQLGDLRNKPDADWTDGDHVRADRLIAGYRRVTGEISEITAEANEASLSVIEQRERKIADLEEGLRTGRYALETGSGPEALGEETRRSTMKDFDTDPLRDARDLRRPKHSNPWDQTTPSFSSSPNAAVSELRSRAYSAIEAMSGASDEMREQATKVVETFDDAQGSLARYALITSDPDYVSAFGSMLRGDLDLLTPQERAAVRRTRELQRAMSLTDASGGFMVPLQLDPSVVLTSAGYVNPLRKISRVVVATTDEWEGVSSTGVTASYDAEAAEVSDDSPTLVQPTVPNHKAQAFVPFSIEIGMDAANFSQEMLRLLTDSRDDLESEKFALGSGVGEPTGIITAIAATAGSRVASVTADTYAVGDVYALHQALPARFRPRGSWMARVEIINRTRQFGTADGHSFLTHLSEDTPERLLGRPIYESSEMDGTIDAAQDNDILIFGDFRHFVIADRAGMVVELVPHLFGAAGRPKGQRGLYAWWRNGSDSIADEAFRLLRA